MKIIKWLSIAMLIILACALCVRGEWWALPFNGTLIALAYKVL